ncbi:MAG TPA: putative DNA binding domain-containing protein [Candidatus Anaerostipes excrementavium]|uniref:DNA binding domain-containing protein n=1 Tax=Candidatus Anaerostipes excrementavium TaxID=2838463 RepID=A0A9D1WZL6_9FIRM|nr:RNA-binding domain-containing protein [uncultured Anaerostipes sp.]HIX68885.1 putative DNA binding domain-containing protein [Candidatus Anaerostipes excrementavium]
MLYTLEEIYKKKEDQTYDRKSARKNPKGLSNHIVAFANADGGTLVIGIEDDFTVTGIDDYQNNVNDILRVPFDYCKPSVRVMTETVDCIDKDGKANHLLIITIPQSSELHANQQDDVYYRMGDKSKKLNFDERLQLMYAKGSRYYEDEPVFRSSIDDIDFDFVEEYCKKIGYGKSAKEYIQQNNDYVVRHDGREEMSGAALLLFGKNPQRFFQRARVRFIRYDGTEAKVGTEMNVIKDEIFHGRILDVVRQALDFVSSQIKMFDDRITVESPGSLPGIVRLNNLRTVHFSRNPKIAEFLHQYEYVKEFGEGIDRMFHEMENAGLPAPEYSDNAFMLNATIRNGEINGEINSDIGELNPALLYLNKNESAVYHLIEEIPQISRQKMAEKIGVSSRTIDRTIQSLIKKNLIRRKGSKKTGHWEIIE